MLGARVTECATALKPCPFCGGTADYDNSDNGPYEWVSCSECGARGPAMNYNEHGLGAAEKMWNRRPLESAAVHAVAEALQHPTSG